MNAFLILAIVLAIPWVLFIIPLQYSDKISKKMLKEDFSLNPTDYME